MQQRMAIYPMWLNCWCSNPPRENVEGFEEEPKATVSLPYVQGVSQALNRVLRPLQNGLRTLFRAVMKTLIGKLMHPKDTVSEMERSNVVCCIPCVDCSATYVGETKRKLGERVD